MRFCEADFKKIRMNLCIAFMRNINFALPLSITSFFCCCTYVSVLAMRCQHKRERERERERDREIVCVYACACLHACVHVRVRTRGYGCVNSTPVPAGASLSVDHSPSWLQVQQIERNVELLHQVLQFSVFSSVEQLHPRLLFDQRAPPIAARQCHPSL